MNIGGNNFRRNKTIVAIEMCILFAKIAVTEESKEGRQVTRLFKKDLEGKETLGGLLAKEKIDFDELIIVLSRNQVTMRNLELPSVDPGEIRDIINIQAGKQTPFPREDLIADFEILGSSRQRYTKVLLAIAQKSVVNGHLDGLSGRREAVRKIVLGSECLANWYPFIYPKIRDETFAIIYFDVLFSDFCVISKGKLLFTMLLDLDVRNLSEEGWSKKFEDEIGSALKSYKEGNIGPVFNKVVFMESNRFVDASRGILSEKFSLQVSGPFAASGAIKLSKQADELLRQEEKEGILFSKMIGLMLDPDRPALDFSPLDMKMERRERARKKKFAVTATLLAAIFFVGLMIFLEGVYSKTLILKRMDAQLKRLEQETSGIQKESARIELIKKRLDAKNSAIEVLVELYKNAPPGAYLTAIVYDESGTVSLRGTSTVISDVYKYVKALKASPIFSDVKAKYVTKRKDLSDFEIICQLNAR